MTRNMKWFILAWVISGMVLVFGIVDGGRTQLERDQYLNAKIDSLTVKIVTLEELNESLSIDIEWVKQQVEELEEEGK